MAVTFTPPPTWPAPPAGFVPPSGWHPDPAWGSAPDGWVFYTENGLATAAPAGAWQPSAPPAPAAPYAGPTASTAPSASFAGAPTPQQTGMPGIPAPGFAYPGIPPQPAPKKSRVMLFVIIGVVVLALAVAAVIGVLLTRPKSVASSPAATTTTTASPAPTTETVLTADQFNQIYPEGSTFQGSTITKRYTEANSPTPRTDACDQALVQVIVNASDLIIAQSSAGNINAGRFADATSADLAFTTAATSCTDKGSGTVDGGQYFTTDFSLGSGVGTAHATVVVYANVMIIAYLAKTPTDDSVAQALRDEVVKAAS